MRDPALHSAHVWLNPYANVGREHRAAVTIYQRTDRPLGGERSFGVRYGGLNALTELIRAGVTSTPETLPSALDFALNAVTARDVVMPSHEALDFGPPNSLPVRAASCGVDASLIDDVVDDLFERFAVWARRNSFVSSPIGLRWVKASSDWLSPQRGRDTVMIEVPVLNGTPNAAATLDRYVQHVMDRWQARPHWGQQNPMRRGDLLHVYGADAVAAFERTRDRFDPLGVFDGSFSRQIGLEVNS